MENKYYTPELEEFHVGFEYEFNDCSNNDWQKAIIKDGTQIDDITRKENRSSVYSLRVKHLDREDIEECGWKYNGTMDINEEDSGNVHYQDCWTITIDNTQDKEKYFQLYISNEKIHISFVEYRNSVGSEENTLFEGTIRNKSELSKLMKQLNISKQ